MHKIPRLFAALVASAALLSVPVALAQDAKDAKSKAAPARADAAAKGKDLYSQSYFDFMLKQRTAQGQPDTPELRTAVRDELNTRELLVREAKKQGIDNLEGGYVRTAPVQQDHHAIGNAAGDGNVCQNAGPSAQSGIPIKLQ